LTPLRVGVNARCLEESDTRGLSRYASCLLRALSARADVDLVLFSMTPPAPVHMRGIRAEVITFGGRETEWQERALPAQLRRERIDVFHAPADRGLPWRRGCAQIVTVHDSYERAHWRELFRSWKQRAWYWKHELTNRFRADAILTVSDTTARDLAARGVAPAARLTRTYLAPAEEFQAEPLADDADIVARHGVRGPYILYVGGYDTRKNVDTLVRAFDRLAWDHQLVIVARQLGAFHDLAASWHMLRCRSRLHCLEVATADLPAFYRQAHIFVNPSLWESFSFQTLEAMACGTPVIASNRTAIPEIAGDAAVLVDAADVGALASAIGTLAADAPQRAALRDRGLRRAGSFSWQATADQTVQAYRRILAGRPPRHRT
jgi:glycosyltransferase involved in cell wall biosynthesis